MKYAGASQTSGYATAEKNAAAKGVKLWKDVQVYELQGQQRARGCAEQARLVDLLRERVEYPLTDQVLELVKSLSVGDFQRDPLWKTNATYLCYTNADRAALNKQLLQSFAMATNAAVVRWKNEVATLSGQMEHLEEAMVACLVDGFTYFAVGAPVMVLENVKTGADLANGSVGKLYGAVFRDPGDQQQFELCLSRGWAEEQTTFDQGPEYLVIELPSDDRYARVPTLVPGKRIIPLKLSQVVEETNLTVTTIGKITWKKFPVDLAFAVTFHKCQGLTLDRVAVVLSNLNRITYEMLLVGLTRVASNDHLRFLCDPQDIVAAFAQIKKLSSNPSVITYFRRIGRDHIRPLPSEAELNEIAEALERRKKK